MNKKIKKVLSILAIPLGLLIYIILGVLDPGLNHKEIRERLSKFDIVMRLIYMPYMIFSSYILSIVIVLYGYREILLYFVIAFTVGSIIEDLRYHSIFIKKKLWSEILSHKVFHIILIIVVFDVGYHLGLGTTIKESLVSGNSLYNPLLIVGIIIVILLYQFVLRTLPQSIERLLPDVRMLFAYTSFVNSIIQIGALVIFVVLIYTALYYVFNAVYNFNGFDIYTISFVDCLFYSFSIFFSSSVSNLKANTVLLKAISATESITSYALFVIFINYLVAKKINNSNKNQSIS